jgi:hypothetical protein
MMMTKKGERTMFITVFGIGLFLTGFFVGGAVANFLNGICRESEKCGNYPAEYEHNESVL